MEARPIDGERIGRHQLLTEIGTGPLGSLTAACITAGPEQGRIVALRQIPAPSVERELRERLILAGGVSKRMRHARLAAVLDVVPCPSSLAIVSEYVESASLRSVMQRAAIGRTPLPPPVAVGIVSDVLRALRAARDLWRDALRADRHASIRNPHGGLLPDSVWIASFGETLLADFGIAAVAARVPGLLRHARALAYRAPEQLEGSEPDEKSDVYSAGVLLWEMLANRTLPAVDVRGIPRLDSITRLGAPIPSMLVAIVSEAVARDPQKRFPSLDELYEALRTLTREAVASPEQIAVAVDRLVSRELEARRAAIDGVAGYERPSGPPGSARTTSRPPAPAGVVRVSLPPDGQFTQNEAPTARRQTPQPRSLPAAAPSIAAMSPPSAPQQAVLGAALEPARSLVPEPNDDDLASGVRTRAAHDTSEPEAGLALTSPLPPVPAQPARTLRFALLAALAVALLIAGTLVLTMLRSGRTATAPKASGEPRESAIAEPAPARSAAVAEPEPPSKIDEPARVEEPPAPAPRATAPAPAAPAPARDSKSYRPRGI